MSPMTLEQRQRLLNKPGVTESELDEYERLLVHVMFNVDHLACQRILQLYRKLYPELSD